MGRSVIEVSIGGFRFPYSHGDTRRETVDHNPSVRVSDVFAVIRSDNRAAAVRDQEFRSRNRGCASPHKLRDNKRLFWRITEGECLRIIGFYGDSLRRGVHHIAFRRFRLRHGVHTRLEIRNRELSVGVRAENAVAGCPPFVICDGFAVHTCDAEFRAGERLLRKTV